LGIATGERAGLPKDECDSPLPAYAEMNGIGLAAEKVSGTGEPALAGFSGFSQGIHPLATAHGRPLTTAAT
jgi:hypothetical protein